MSASRQPPEPCAGGTLAERLAVTRAGVADRPVLELAGISKQYGAVTALAEVDLVLNAGEVLGLVGDNGAGKSTLVNIVAGAVSPSAGTIRVDGEERVFRNPVDARAVGIETVYQTLSLIPTLNIAENVYLGRETFGKGSVRRAVRLMDKGRMQRDVQKGLAQLALALPSPRTKVAALSGGQRQLVAIARAILWGSHVVLLDEPTAALGVHQTEVVLSFVETLREHGVAVVLISHNMEQVLRVSDRIVVLRLGRTIADVSKNEVTATDVVALITGAKEGQRT
jgi:ABC-type sugar transport system ATPase subunit